MRTFMLRCAILLAAALLLSAASVAQVQKQTITVAGKRHTYYLFVPATAAPAKPAPLLLLLHGSGRNGATLTSQWEKFAAEQGIVLVAPDAMKPEIWQLTEDGPAFLQALLDEVRAKASVDARRMYIFGHSAGAQFATLLAMLESNFFAAVAVHAGGFNVGDEAAVAYATRKIPLLLVAGARDAVVPIAAVRKTHQVLVREGFPAEFLEIPNHTHDYYSRSGEINAKVWAFLTRHTLAADPEFVQYAQ